MEHGVFAVLQEQKQTVGLGQGMSSGLEFMTKMQKPMPENSASIFHHIDKRDNKKYMVYAVRDNKNGFPHFLIYRNN